jgi:hypothetical protein
LESRLYGEVDSKSFTIAQELFCDLGDVVVPGDHRRTAKTANPHLVSKHEDALAYSQLGLLYTRVTTSFAERTGIIPQERRSSREVVRIGADVGVVTQAKRLMETVKPLGNRAPSRPNAVVLYFAPPTAAVEERYAPVFAALGISPSSQAIGSVLYTRQGTPEATSEKSHLPKQRVAQVFPTIDEAMRKTHHEESQYERETAQIQSLKDRWLQFAQSGVRAWVSERELKSRIADCRGPKEVEQVQSDVDAMNGAIIGSYKALLEESSKFVKNAKHEEKIEFKERLERMMDRLAQSKTGRINPEPVLLQVDANYRLLQVRLEDIRVKRSYNQNDQGLLRDVMATESENLSSIADSLCLHIERFTGKERIFREAMDFAPRYEREKNQMFWKLQVPRADGRGADKRLRGIRVRPFTTFRDKIEECSRYFEKSLRPGKVKEVAKALATMFLVTRAFKLNRIIEDLRVGLISAEQKHAEAFNEACEALVQLEARPTLFKRAAVAERTESARELKALSAKLLETVRNLQKQLLALQITETKRNNGAHLPKEREALVSAALDALAEYDFEGFARGLVL